MENFLILLVIALTAIWLINRYNLSKKIKQQNADITNLKAEKEKLISLNADLSRFQEILDAEQEAKRIIEKANQDTEILISTAKSELENARIESTEIKQSALKDAQAVKEKAQQFLTNATSEASVIIKQANIRAEEIAGNAYKAMQNASEFEKTVKAMKNIIEGYGDQYLVPTYSLLDDLAEEFAHTDAGEKLKIAREKSVLMIKNGTAAKCDYVEVNRKETAINFVLDAFNGKVDSILSKVKKDNFGTLEQKIKDSFQVVNYNGKAFRNAEITSEFLNARIDELRWAIVAQELKWQEQEEQRRIKEQIRDEERARREFEKAMKEAQKEEETLKKLIEKAQSQVSTANEEQRAKLEEKLKELEAKLIEAEEKNQRALSMAQQTKSGNVYIISNIGSFGENIYKIGMTRRLEPLDRIKELGDASVPFEFDVHAMIYSEDAPKLENDLHKTFMLMQLNKVNPRKEFFKIGLINIKEEVDKLGIAAKWTMTADARQYRESLAIEKSIAIDSKKKEEWEKSQRQIENEYQLDLEEIELN